MVDQGNEKVKVEEKSVVEKPPEQSKTEDNIAKLQSELEATKQNYIKLEERYKGEQRRTSKADEDLKRLRDVHEKIDTLEDRIALLVEYVAEGRGKSTDEFETEARESKADLLKKTDERLKQSKLKRQQDELARRVGEIQKRTEALGLTPKDKVYKEIYRDATSGNLDWAEESLAELESAKESSKEKKEDKPVENKEPKETEEQRITRLAEEKARAYLKEKGLLTDNRHTPAGDGGGLTPEKVANMTPQERWDRRDEIAKISINM